MMTVEDPANYPLGRRVCSAATGGYFGDFREGLDGWIPRNMEVNVFDTESSDLNWGAYPGGSAMAWSLWIRWAVLDGEGVPLRARLLGRVARLHGPCLLRALTAETRPGKRAPSGVWPGPDYIGTELHIYSRLSPRDGGSGPLPLVVAFSPRRGMTVGPSADQWCPTWGEALRLPQGIARELRRERAHDDLYLIETPDYNYPTPRPSEPGHVRR